MSRRTFATLLAIFTVAAVLRLNDLARPSVWEDEVVSINLARQPTPKALLAQLRKVDATNAPLHPLLLQAWIHLAGDSVLNERALSAFCGIASVFLVYAIAQTVYGTADAWLAAWLQAINPLDVYHSREARMYEVLVLLTCVGWWLLLRFREKASRTDQAAYLAILILLVYTHPLGLLMVAALGVGYWTTRPTSQLTPTRWWALQLTMATALAPWIAHYLDHTPESLIAPAGWKLYAEWPSAFTGGRTAGVLLGATLALTGALAAWKTQRAQTQTLIAWFTIPIALLTTYAVLRHPIFGPRRYLLYIGPPYLILIARGIGVLPRWPRRATIVGLTTIAMIQALNDRIPNRPDWPAVARTIQHVDPTAPILVLDDRANQSACLAFYLGKTSHILPDQWAKEVRETQPPALWKTIGKIRETNPPDSLPPSYRLKASQDLARVRLEYWIRGNG